MIYSIDGSPLQSCCSLECVAANGAYDISGDLVFSPKSSLKVMSYNVGQWYLGNHDNIPADLDGVYYDLQNGIISTNNADVLLLEEYTAQFSKAGRTSLSWLSQYYPYYQEQTDGTTTTVTQRAIYTKYPISQYRTHAFHGYYYDSCYITINGIDFYFIVTHFHWNNQSYRSEEADIVLADMNTHEYAILGGDLNTADNYDTTGVDYVNVIKKFVDAGYNVANGGSFGFLETYSDQPNGSYTGCLDNIITSGNILITDAYVDETKLTDGLNVKVDHMPLIATLQIGGTS